MEHIPIEQFSPYSRNVAGNCVKSSVYWPRKARIDVTDALHHIIVRGIERRKIFYDDNGQRGKFKQTVQAHSLLCYCGTREAGMTTVQEKEARFPTDARLYDSARQHLVDAAKKRNLALRQNYNCKSKQLIAQQSRYAHARQMKRAKRCTRKLRTYLG